MKKLLKLLPLVVVLVLCTLLLVACGINKYKNNLEAEDYEVNEWDEEEIADNLDDIGLDAEDFNIKGVLEADKGNDGVIVIEFGSKDEAEDFVDSAAMKAVAIMMTVEQDGKFVIFGTEDAVEVALG